MAAIAGVVMILAAIGIWHLLSSPKPSSKTQSAIARISAGAEKSLTPAAPSSAAASPKAERQVEITKIEQTEKRGPHGETFVVATIGLASRANVEKNGVEIHVYFYDLTVDNEIRPTDAQVTYEWLTPVRDWSDPTPKYLAATYLKRRPSGRAAEQLRYGGFIVRLFSGGKLRDERSQPEALLSLFRSNASEQVPSSSIAPAASPPPQTNIATTKRTPSVIASPTSDFRPPTSDSTLPYGKPIPGKPGFVSSPYDPQFLIDVRGFPPGTLVIDPNTNKPFAFLKNAPVTHYPQNPLAILDPQSAILAAVGSDPVSLPSCSVLVA